MAKGGAQPSATHGVFRRPFAEQSAFFRNKLGNLVPTARWDDIQRSAHDTAFMVAGAIKADLLSDLAMAVDRVVTEGKSLDAFRKDFRDIVERRGWHNWTGEGSKKGTAWRTRVIYQTNASTAYAAGRLAQLREGGFEYWVYRHSGSADPRPEHLAWDGLVLPADDPFWTTHYPPNGWGCGCYVIGARSKDAAKRLGGDLEKSRPSDAIDSETGTPIGIDKGWDYQPGDRVSDTVRQMAEKTMQWDYELAKGFMQGVPVGMRDQLARSYRSLPSVADDTRRYAQRVLSGRNKTLDTPKYKTLGLLTENDVAAVKTIKELNVSGYDFALDVSGVNHVEKEHGVTSTLRSRGERPITAQDYSVLPTLLNDGLPWKDAGVSWVENQPQMKRRIEINGKKYEAVFVIRPGRKMLVLKTFYIP